VRRRVLEFCTSEGFSVAEVTIDPEDHGPRPGVVDVVLTVFGRRPAALLAANLKDMEGVLSVSSADPNAVDD
jgi:acetolactate synthase regulatory subunit